MKSAFSVQLNFPETDMRQNKYDTIVMMIVAIDASKEMTVKKLMELFGVSERVIRNYLTLSSDIFDVEILSVGKLKDQSRYYAIGSWGLLNKEAAYAKYRDSVVEKIG